MYVYVYTKVYAQFASEKHIAKCWTLQVILVLFQSNAVQPPSGKAQCDTFPTSIM